MPTAVTNTLTPSATNASDALMNYAHEALIQVPRLLSLGDRLSDSSTYGCFDRYYWHYRVLDFPNARFQESAWLLALLYSTPAPNNHYYQSDAIRDWAVAAIGYWAQCQRPDGSVDEVYPFEHSFVATAFSAFAVTETALLLNVSISEHVLYKAGQWLAAHNNMRVANQMAGACAALYNIYKLTNATQFKAAAEQKRAQLETLQEVGGYFLEYGGYDMGYLTIGLSYLTRYVEKSGDAVAAAMVEKGCLFAQQQLSSDGRYDYTNTSRHTQYFYPYAFLSEFLAQPESSAIHKHFTGIQEQKLITPGWLDDRFFIPLAIDFLDTYRQGTAI